MHKAGNRILKGGDNRRGIENDTLDLSSEGVRTKRANQVGRPNRGKGKTDGVGGLEINRLARKAKKGASRGDIHTCAELDETKVATEDSKASQQNLPQAPRKNRPAEKKKPNQTAFRLIKLVSRTAESFGNANDEKGNVQAPLAGR